MKNLAGQNKRQADVRKCVRLALSVLNPDPAFHGLLLEFLSRPGRLLGPGEGQWPRFVTQTSRALGGDARHAAWPAAAVEFAAAAIDVADDLADGDLSDDARLVARAPNAGLALAWLAQHCVAQAVPDLGPARSIRIGALLADGSAACCGGQDLDVLLEDEPRVSEARALFVSSRKAGALVAMAASVGAACATDDLSVIELAGKFGAHVGIVAQLVNDIAGIPHGDVPGSTDILRRKKTLPVAYALACAEEDGLASILNWYEANPPAGAATDRTIAEAIVSLGGLHFAWAVAKSHEARGIDILGVLERAASRPQVRSLRKLVPSLEGEQ